MRTARQVGGFGGFLRYRTLEIGDLPDVSRLYRQMLEESRTQPVLHYPRWDATTLGEMTAYLYTQLTRPSRALCPHCQGDLGPTQGVFISVVGVCGGRIADGHVIGGRVKGMAWGTVARRAIGTPKMVAYAELVYVDPPFRGGKSRRKAVAVQLLWRLAARATQLAPDVVLEGAYVPGSHGERLWRTLGLRPYVTYAAYLDRAGTPRHARELFAPRRKDAQHGKPSRRASGAE